MGTSPAFSQYETFLACDTMDEVCYSSNDDNDDCDERRLERESPSWKSLLYRSWGICHHVMALLLTDEDRGYSKSDRDQMLSRWER